MLDASCPIGEATWDSARWSAAAALSAAELVRDNGGFSYALCRPPGHHAQSDAAAGFCYLNNTALAAGELRRDHPRVAVLDIDLHHGNGTQQVFYRRRDIFTVSIHADPVRFYPFFWGAADETGAGDGEGYNLNLPLPRGSGDAVFLAALEQALTALGAFSPGALVIALGLDAFEGDPFGGLQVSTAGFAAIARQVASALPVPTVIVQEGGYLCDDLGANLQAFLGAYAEARGG
jgi:acetoin utilization deacetylase AcuC-like enzyme